MTRPANYAEARREHDRASYRMAIHKHELLHRDAADRRAAGRWYEAQGLTWDASRALANAIGWASK